MTQFPGAAYQTCELVKRVILHTINTELRLDWEHFKFGTQVLNKSTFLKKCTLLVIIEILIKMWLHLCKMLHT